MKEIVKYAVVSAVILCLDILWIVSNMTMYSNSPMVVNNYAALIAYAFVIFSSIYIAIPFTKLHIEKNDGIVEKLYKSFLYGGTVGLAINGVYNCTSMAIYKNYELHIAVYDILWGTILQTIAVFTYVML
jgi:uncharacterized membrane protein